MARNWQEEPVAVLGLSVRGRNILQRLGVQTIGQLYALTPDEILAGRSFGETSLRELREKLAARGLRLRSPQGLTLTEAEWWACSVSAALDARLAY